jgi:hypothetical protein
VPGDLSLKEENAIRSTESFVCFLMFFSVVLLILWVFLYASSVRIGEIGYTDSNKMMMVDAVGKSPPNA